MKKKIKVPEPRQLPSGAWRVQVTIDRQRYSVTDDDPEKALAKALALKTRIIKSRKDPSDKTLRQAAEEFIDRLEGRRSPTTIDNYRKILRTDFQGILDKKLHNITARMVDDAVGQMCKRESKRGRGLSPKTIKNNWAFMMMVLHEHLPDLDVRVRLPEVKRSVTLLPNQDEIIRAVVGTSVELPCLLAAWLSLSMSEIKGLTKSRSVRGEYLIVGEETVVYVDGKEIRKAGGKEASRTRILRIPEYLKELIDKVPGDIIVPETSRSIVRRYKTALAKAGVPYLKFHGLRHLNASLMAGLHIDRAVARARGGWANNTVMDTIYTHALQDSMEQADQKMDGYFLRVIRGGK